MFGELKPDRLPLRPQLVITFLLAGTIMAAVFSVALRRIGDLSVTDLARVVTAKLFKYAPRVLKYLIYVVLLAQYRSWPFAWHFILLKPVFILRIKYYLYRLRYSLSPPHVRRQKQLEWMEGLSKVGMNPFDLQVTYKTVAGFDDIDYNLHLSNSSYPKRLDAARLKAAIELCPTFFRVGGWMGLGATHFTFLREIPIFSTYEVRITVMSWDNKWLYCVAKFVTKARKSKGKGKKGVTQPLPAPSSDVLSANVPLRTADGVYTPLPGGSGTSSPPNGNGSGNTTAAALAAQLIERPEHDGAVINCIAVSELVCKIGRLTIPPALVLAVEGFSRLPPDGARGYSHKNPPPHWERVRELRGDAYSTTKGSLKTLKDFFTTNWRDVPEGERWWEDALGGEVEERRLRALDCMQALRKGMEEARAI